MPETTPLPLTREEREHLEICVEVGILPKGQALVDVLRSYEVLVVQLEAELAQVRAQQLRDQPRITTRCPSCGHQTLFIGSGGHLTCSWLECKSPSVARTIEALATGTPPPAPQTEGE